MALRLGPLCLAALLVLAGCSGSPAPEDAGTTTATTVSTTSDLTSLPSTTTTVRTALDAGELSAADRDLLRRAVENGSVRATRSNLTGRLTPETDGWRVRYRGTAYELSWQREGLRGVYHLDDATRVNASAAESADGVVAYENLTADARQLFDAARSGAESGTRGREAFPDQLRDHRYVTDDGDYYELRVTVGDYIVYRLSLTTVES